MILEFNQIGRQPNPVFEGKIGQEVVVTGKGSTHLNDAYVIYGNERIELSSTPHREKIEGKVATQMTDLFLEGKRIGYVYPDLVETKKVLFLSFGYDCFIYRYRDEEYVVYEIGLGADQHYFCVYKGEETVAVIKKADRVDNYCDKYTVYALDSVGVLTMAVLTMYVDCILYPDHGESMGEVHEDDVFLTTQKELNAKYDPTFIPRIKEMEGLTE